MVSYSVILKGGAQVWNTESTSACRGCKAMIWWAETREGRKMPISIDKDGAWVSHFAICPAANSFRKRGSHGEVNAGAQGSDQEHDQQG